MGIIRTMIGKSISVAVAVGIMLLCFPFMKLAMGGMFDTYGTMAAAVMDGSGGEYADNMLTKMETGSQVVLDGVGEWAFGTIEQIGDSDFLAQVSDFLKGFAK